MMTQTLRSAGFDGHMHVGGAVVGVNKPYKIQTKGEVTGMHIVFGTAYTARETPGISVSLGILHLPSAILDCPGIGNFIRHINQKQTLEEPGSYLHT